jgi:hypothetical protein
MLTNGIDILFPFIKIMEKIFPYHLPDNIFCKRVHKKSLKDLPLMIPGQSSIAKKR